MQDYWSFRPTTQSQELPPFVTGRVPGPQTGTSQAGVAPPIPPQLPLGASAPKATPPPLPGVRTGAPREADVEVIQDAIKRLLEEVNAAEQQEARNGAPQRANRAPAMPPPLPGTASLSADAAIDRSVDALRMTADTMRGAFGQREASPRGAEQPLAAQQPSPQQHPLPPFVRGGQQPGRPVHPADARARLMADAISAGRIDVALEPILGLEDQQTRHYEVSVRLRDADGNPLDVTANGPDLRGTGLLPLFDGVRIARTAAVARRLEERGKAGSVFSAFSGESVADEHFLGELAETLHQRGGLVAQLVLSFTQTDVRAFSTPEWDSLADMRALGFRFAISALTDLDMDFEALAEQGFAFVKLDASVFLEGLPAPSGRLPSSDVCRHLAMHGLTLVVEHIDDQDKLARVFGFGVLLGQGQLFGGARPVRADVASGRRSTTAAA
jgi:cyclic-di-GMP phosphodiesterase TipF (flagellum assembly factor)